MDCESCIHDGECDGLPYCGGRGYEPADGGEAAADGGDWYDQRDEDEYAAETWLRRNEP